MGEVSAEVAASLLREAGLTHSVFEAGAVAADITSRVKMNDTLDELLIGSPGLDPTAFDPDWHR